MPTIDREKRNAYAREYYSKNSEKWKKHGGRKLERKLEIAAWVEKQKARPCMDCNGVFPACAMDFDHRDGTEKRWNIARITASGRSRDFIQKEMDKCDLVCSNCHRVRTKGRKVANTRKPTPPWLGVS